MYTHEPFLQDDLPLVAAVERQDFAEVERLLNEGADIDAETDNGFTPLSVAILIESLDMCKLLLDRGASTMKNASFYGALPFQLAADIGNLEVASLFAPLHPEWYAGMAIAAYQALNPIGRALRAIPPEEEE